MPPIIPRIVSRPIWLESNPSPALPSLRENTTADVCIVGAGIAGISTAYRLADAGLRVVVVDAGDLGRRQTGATTAHLANAIDDRYVEIERLHGEDGARLAADSHTAAIDYIEQTVRTEQIHCEFERLDGFLFAGDSASHELLDQELAAARRAGVPVESVQRAPLTGFESGRCLRFENQAQFHPLQYIAALADGISRRRGRIYTSTRAKHIEGGADARVTTENGPEIRAKAVVVATNSPINDLVAIHTKQAPYVSYSIGCRVPVRSLRPALFWDTLDPYHYVRIKRGDGDSSKYDTLIVGGEDHKAGQMNDGPVRFRRLEQWARRRFPIDSVTHHWSGQVMETIDGLAFIGRNPGDHDNVFVATGDSGMGMTHGTIAGLLISDLILDRPNPWMELYNPSRKKVAAIGKFAAENLNVAAEYTSWLSGGDVNAEGEIPRNSGAIVRYGTSKLAVYRDENGAFTRLSAVCPHLKCIVAWNGVEQTWDCPCHGSRFAATGEVLDGPAYGGLPPYETPD